MSLLLLDFFIKVSKKYLINDDLNLSFSDDEYDDRSNNNSSNNCDD